MSIHDFDDLVLDENGEPFGQAFAFTVGNEAAGGAYIVNLMMTNSGEVLTFVSFEDDPDKDLFTIMVPTYEEGVVEALGYLSLHPGWLLAVSETLLEE